MAEEVLYSVADGVATITLNRPERLNALNSAMYHGLIEAFDQTDLDDKVRAVIVTGAGRAFCAGADLSGGARTFDYGQDATAPEAHRDRGGMLVLRIFRSLKPVIAAINGSAVGVGITMTLPMDIRIIADSARLIPTIRGRNQLDAPSGTMPRRANGNATRAPSAMIRMSIGRVMVMPTPTAGPLMAAMTGFSER